MALTTARQQMLDAFYQGATLKDPVHIRPALTDDFTFDGPIGKHDKLASMVLYTDSKLFDPGCSH